MERIKRLILALRILALDITIDGQTKCLARESNPLKRYQIETARSQSRRDRTSLRMAYNATLPPGQIRRWTTA